MTDLPYEIDPICGHPACPVWRKQKQAEATVKFLEERMDAAYAARREARAAYTAHLDGIAKAA